MEDYRTFSKWLLEILENHNLYFVDWKLNPVNEDFAVKNGVPFYFSKTFNNYCCDIATIRAFDNFILEAKEDLPYAISDNWTFELNYLIELIQKQVKKEEIKLNPYEKEKIIFLEKYLNI